MATLTLATTRAVRWAFPSEDEPAMDETRDPRPPKFWGSVLLEYSINEDEATADAEAVRRYYLDQGITPTALRHATSQDLLDRVPVADLEARTGPTTTSSFGNGARLALIYPVHADRAVTDAPVPAELAPLP